MTHFLCLIVFSLKIEKQDIEDISLYCPSSVIDFCFSKCFSFTKMKKEVFHSTKTFSSYHIKRDQLKPVPEYVWKISVWWLMDLGPWAVYMGFWWVFLSQNYWWKTHSFKKSVLVWHTTKYHLLKKWLVSWKKKKVSEFWSKT